MTNLTYRDIHLKNCGRIFVKNYLCEMLIGIHPNEKYTFQKVRLNISVYIQKQYTKPKNDLIIEVYDYDTLITIINKELTHKHIQLQETLCNNLATTILRDQRVTAVQISSEKLSACQKCESIGFEILKFQNHQI